MLKRTFLLSFATFIIFSFSVVYLAAENEKIIQKEKISFDRCLTVITTSEDKLSIAPKITDISEKSRVAVFALSDGTLKITCDGEEGVVIVSTNKNN